MSTPQHQDRTELVRLRAAHIFLAELMLADPVYAPIFERIEAEITAATKSNELIERARAVATHQRATA
jgi:hypothetical protein